MCTDFLKQSLSFLRKVTCESPSLHRPPFRIRVLSFSLYPGQNLTHLQGNLQDLARLYCRNRLRKPQGVVSHTGLLAELCEPLLAHPPSRADVMSWAPPKVSLFEAREEARGRRLIVAGMKSACWCRSLPPWISTAVQTSCPCWGKLCGRFRVRSKFICLASPPGWC